MTILWDTPPGTRKAPEISKLKIICAQCSVPCDIAGFSYNETEDTLMAHVRHHGKDDWAVIKGNPKAIILRLLEAGDHYGRGELGQN